MKSGTRITLKKPDCTEKTEIGEIRAIRAIRVQNP